MLLKLACLPIRAARCGARLGFLLGVTAGVSAGISVVAGACAVSLAAKRRKAAAK